MRSEDPDLDYRVDFLGRLKCPVCQKFIPSPSQPVTCRACLSGGRHGRGRPGPGCKKARCECRRERPQERTIVIEQEGGRRCDTRTPSSTPPSTPRRRLRGKQPAIHVGLSAEERGSREDSRPPTPRSVAISADGGAAETGVASVAGDDEAKSEEPGGTQAESTVAHAELLRSNS